MKLKQIFKQTTSQLHKNFAKNKRSTLFLGLIAIVSIVAIFFFKSATNSIGYAATYSSWTDTDSMTFGHWLFGTAVLQNGKVLVVGGYGVEKSAVLFDPTTGTWTMTGPLKNKYISSFFSASPVVLPNGKVLIAGSTGNSVSSNTAE